MKVLHTSDWHLGQKFIHYEREAEHRLALDWLLDLIEREQVELLVVAGDIFDTYYPPANAQRTYYDFLVRLRQTSCRKAVIVGGNHDSPSMLQAPKALLRAMEVEVVGSAPDDPADALLIIADQEGQPELGMATIPFLRDRDLRFAQTGESGLERVDRIRQAIYDHYQAFSGLIRKTGPAGIPWLATGHLYAGGAQASDRQDNIYIGDLANIRADQFPEVFDYVALGHIHRAQAVGGLEHVRYSGSLIPLSFSETRDVKSVSLLDFGKGRLEKVEIREVPTFRRLKTISGAFEEVVEKLHAFAGRHQDELPPWVEVIVETDRIIPDLDGQLMAEVKDLPLELLKIRIRRTDIREGAESQDIPELSDLDVFEVFHRKCKSLGAPPDDLELLEATFRQLVEELEEIEEQMD